MPVPVVEPAGPYPLWRWAIWIGLIAGLAQVFVMAVSTVVTHRLVVINWDMVWMVPVADAVMLGIAAAVMRVVTLPLGRAAALTVTLIVIVFLAIFGPATMIPRVQFYAKTVLAAGAAVQAARLLARHAGWFDRVVRRTLPVLLAVCVIAALGSTFGRGWLERRAEASLPPAAAGAPNMLLIVLDTVRAGNLTTYGYGRPTSPRLTEFARTGTQFDRALSTSPWTLPSHASIFTGRLPHELSADWQSALDGTAPTLAEALAARGYMTAGFVANLLYATASTGLGRGFLRYEDYPRSIGSFVQYSWQLRRVTGLFRGDVGGDTDYYVRKDASRITDDFLQWLPTRPDRPFFAFLNYFDAHEPYLPPPPFDTAFGHGPLPDLWTRESWTPDQIQRSLDAYDGTLAFMDREVGRLLDRLTAQHLLENTVVVVTSDHGEQFGEHGLFDHANSLYIPLLHVPLVVSYPGHVPAGLRVSGAVSLIDVAATFLDLDGSRPAPGWSGRSLARFWGQGGEAAAGAGAQDNALFSEVSKGINLPASLPVSRGAMQSVVMAGRHYIRGAGTEELYDLERDPGERDNLAGQASQQAFLESARRAAAALTGRPPQG